MKLRRFFNEGSRDVQETFHEGLMLISSDLKLSYAFDSSGRLCCFTNF